MPDEAQFRNAISNLRPIAERYGRFSNHPEQFLEYVNQEIAPEALELHANRSTEQLTREIKGSRQIQPVSFLRHVIARRILNGQDVSVEDIERIKTHIDERDASYFSDFPDLQEEIAHQKERKQSAFHSWKLFTILHGIDYQPRAEECEQWLTDIADFLQDRLDLTGCDRHVAGFDWNQNFGTDYGWVALYPEDAETHQDAYQIFFSVNPDRLRQGIIAGERIKDKRIRDLRDVPVAPDIDVEAMMETYRDLLPRFHKLNHHLFSGTTSRDSPSDTGEQRAWLIAPGQGGARWEEFRAERIAGIGWNEMGPLQQYASRGEVVEACEQNGFSRVDGRACYEFAHEMKEGDLLFAKTGTTDILGVGIVASTYRFDKQRERHKHVRDVRWVERGSWTTLPRARPRGAWNRKKKESGEWRNSPRTLPRKALTELAADARAELEILTGIDGAAEAGYRDPLPVDEALLEAAVRKVIRPELEAGTFDEGDEAYIQHEIIPSAQRHLLTEALEEDPIHHVLEAIGAHHNLLSWREKDDAETRFASAEPEDVREQLTELFQGSAPLQERLEAFLTWGAAGEEGSGEKGKINGTVASFLLMAYNPARYTFCKPTVYHAAAEALLGPGAACSPSEEAARIAHAARLYGDVLRRLRRHWGLPVSNLMHVHTAFYLLSNSDDHLSWGELDSERDRDVAPDDAEPSDDSVPRVNGAQPAFPRYTIRDATEDLFHGEAAFEGWLRSLKTRKNIILQGPPGVGKTFVARRLAYALMGRKDTSRTEMVQFHQSYAYEDFIQGYRPSSGGGFELQNGAFYRFARQAQHDQGRPYVFLIDEINRGNLSKIFGELMMLIEPDKRGSGHAMSLTYQEARHDDFYVPENLHLIGMMNTADRSLAMVDYALRRRFRFIDMEPQFGPRFQEHLRARGASAELVKRITGRVRALNQTIAEDSNLGPGFQIGHSYFCPREDESPTRTWYERIVRHEIGPLLREYWFDAPENAKSEVEALLA